MCCTRGFRLKANNHISLIDNIKNTVGIKLYKSKVNAAVYQEIFEHFMLPSADKLYGDADFLFQLDFSTCPQCQNHFLVVC